ncbi:MAG TPA: tetratricopeptide repeat protein [Isosphaeraceae bacterium]
MALTLGNLGLVVRDQGDLTEARRCQEQALRIKEEVYGHKHPHVAMTLGNLGGVLAQDGEPERAKPLVERALGLFRQFLGDEHPHTVQARGQLQEIEERLRSASRVEESPGFDTAEDSGRGSGPEPG